MPMTIVLRIPDGPIVLVNPANGYRETVAHAGLWCLIFGFFYLAYKGAWAAAGIAFAAAIFTGGLSWFGFPFIARRLVVKSYLQRGWRLVDHSPTDDDAGV
ncbi:MAG TPA: hypothetical protein VGL83_13640 [Stellaceae bacterium]|jgi:hypothetical protein